MLFPTTKPEKCLGHSFKVRCAVTIYNAGKGPNIYVTSEMIMGLWASNNLCFRHGWIKISTGQNSLCVCRSSQIEVQLSGI